ncbi:MAG: hypothetical protein ABI776_04975 [Nocardioidaceae bacterium]
MNHLPRLAPIVASLSAGLLLISGAASAHVPSTAPTQTRATTTCLVSVDRIDRYRSDGLPLESCIRALRSHGTDQERCLLVADRIEQWIVLGQRLPSCVRRLQQGATHSPHQGRTIPVRR